MSVHKKQMNPHDREFLLRLQKEAANPTTTNVGSVNNVINIDRDQKDDLEAQTETDLNSVLAKFNAQMEERRKFDEMKKEVDRHSISEKYARLQEAKEQEKKVSSISLIEVDEERNEYLKSMN